MENIDKIVEAIVFASGTPIAKSDICEKVPELTAQKLNGIVKKLKDTYSGESGILFAEFNGKLQFMSNPKYGDVVADVLTPLKEKELTKTLLEVLATVAYKQPITRVEIDDMRAGTNSEYALSALLKAGLVEAVGRKDTVGRPVLYGTTDEFLKKFMIESLDDLPDYAEVLENLKLLNPDIQSTLFHTRTILEGEEGEELVAADVAGGEETVEAEVKEAGETDEFDELPDYLEGAEVYE